MVAYTARTLGTSALLFPINLTAHGFKVGDVLTYNGSTYVLAKANNATNARVVGIVCIVVDVNNFILSQVGYIPDIVSPSYPYTPLVAGTLYWLDPNNAGALTSTQPSSVGQVALPLLLADSTSSGYFVAGFDDVITSGSVFSWQTATTNTNMSSNQGWFTNSGGTLNMTLPPSANVNVGDVVKLSNLSGNFSLLPNTSQTINFGDAVASTSITSTKVGDYIEVICYTIASSNALWQTTGIIGNLSYS